MVNIPFSLYLFCGSVISMPPNDVFKIRKNYANLFISDLIKGMYFKPFEVYSYIDFKMYFFKCIFLSSFRLHQCGKLVWQFVRNAFCDLGNIS